MLLTKKLIEEVSDPSDAKEYYESFLRKKNKKSVKKSEIITYQPKAFVNSNIDVKSVITEHPKLSHKLPKTIKKGEKVVPNSSLYSDTKKRENILNKEKLN